MLLLACVVLAVTAVVSRWLCADADVGRRLRRVGVCVWAGVVVAVAPVLLGAGEPLAAAPIGARPTPSALPATATPAPATATPTSGDPPTATPAPHGAAPTPAVPTATRQISIIHSRVAAGVTWHRPDLDRIPDGEIAAALGMESRVVDQCGSVFAAPGTSDLYDRAQLDRACTFVLTTLRLQPPPQPVPVFLRDAAQNARGDIPLAAPVVIAIDAEDGPSTNTLDTLAHEFTHGLGGADRDIGDACLEEGMARYMGRLFVGRDAAPSFGCGDVAARWRDGPGSVGGRRRHVRRQPRRGSAALYRVRRVHPVSDGPLRWLEHADRAVSHWPPSRSGH
jgi:hypothetical protein